MLRFLPCLLLMLLGSVVSADAIKIDLNPDNARNDSPAPRMIDWRIGNPATAPLVVDHLSLHFTNPSSLRPAMWKGGYAYASPMASDGVVQPSGAMQLEIAGLVPGKHSIATFHNAIDKSLGECTVSIDGQTSVKVTPTYRVPDDADAACGYLEFQTPAGTDRVTLTIVAADPSEPVVLNAIWIDTPNPKRQANRPSPATSDLHAPENPRLTWTAPPTATSHRLYFGTSAQAVANANERSPEFVGELKAPAFQTRDLKVQATYYWRVDEVGNGGVTPGEVWLFKTRLLAFPGAEGYGRFAQGGRGGTVYEVTTLDDYDANEPPIPGSYRAAIEADGPRTVVFRVSGLIRLKRPCIVRNGFITIAGQTAPGDGICLANYSAGLATHDAIVRFIRVRVGDESRKAMDGLGLGSSSDSIIDHCSISWAMDEGTSSRSGKNITFQWNIISESLQHAYHYNAADRSKFETHAFAGSISGDIGSYHHNLLAHNTDRNWSLAGGLTQDAKYAGRLDIRNNVVYNWVGRTTDGGVAELNYVNNYYKPYPKQTHYVTWLLKLDPLNPDWGTEKYYMAGNVMEGFDYEKDNWQAFVNGKDVEKQVRVDKPIFPSYVKEETAAEAYPRVLAGAGATLPKRDVIDARIVEEVRTGTVHYQGTKASTWGPGDKNAPNYPGIIDTQTDVHDADDSPVKPWPNYRTYNVPADSDHDGMPDRWEVEHHLDPADPSDGNADAVGDGYTNLERYLNDLIERGRE